MEGDAKKKKDKKEKTFRLRKEYNNPTPKGEKKDLRGEMPAEYDPPVVEAAWYDWWEKRDYFKANNQDTTREKFVIVIPPPNVTGSLHMGHALTNSIQDALCRWHRMNGKNVLWVPGTDHAGIATQVVVEKKLKKETGKSRHDLGREAFVEQVWKWKDQYGKEIINQLRRLGSSLDWSREVFTMDEKLSKAVTEAFVRLYEEGLIYRGTRLVNWCCALKTAISDIEVKKKELEKRTRCSVPGYEHPQLFGVLTQFAYLVEGTGEEVVVATTRLETMLGDTAVAIHPDDKRYKHLHGKFVVHPFDGRKIPIICDAELVDMTFGTGVVKVTPAHDPNDYACGLRNSLPMINLLTDDGYINENGGQFKGLKRFDARREVHKALQAKGLIRGEEDNKMVLPLCSRSDDVVEPLLKPQWWVKCKGMADEGIKAVRTGELAIIPDQHKIKWYRWLENIQDWCISRQLWWGHRVPAYLVSIEGQPAPDPENQANWVVGRNLEEARARAAAKHKDVDPSKISLQQDPDVLDTWFSSGLFPFSSLGWPNEESADLKTFYPTSLLETGHDILFFWVARMVMMGTKLTGKLPFRQVFLHAMVRDAHGRKMSKSLGNVIDPIDVTEGIRLENMVKKLTQGNLDTEELAKATDGLKKDFPEGISECGTDAMRFALCAYTAQGKSINLDINRVIAYRNFCNKLWNAMKFFFLHIKGVTFTPTSEITPQSPIEQWILSRLHYAVKSADQGWNSFDFALTTTSVYNFFLHDLCDVYLEVMKPLLDVKGSPLQVSYVNTLYYCLEAGLRLLHPFMPFVTEELFQYLPKNPAHTWESIMIAPYPTIQTTQKWGDEALEQTVERVLDISHHARSARVAANVEPAATPKFFIVLHNAQLTAQFAPYVDVIKILAKASAVELVQKGKDQDPPSACAVDILDKDIEVHLYLKGVIDVAAEIKRQEVKLQKAEKQVEAIKKRMAVPNYETKVPENIRMSNTEKFNALAKEIANIQEAIKKLTEMKD